MISETYRLNDIFKLSTNQADICVQLDKNFEVTSNDTITESIL